MTQIQLMKTEPRYNLQQGPSHLYNILPHDLFHVSLFHVLQNTIAVLWTPLG